MIMPSPIAHKAVAPLRCTVERGSTIHGYTLFANEAVLSPTRARGSTVHGGNFFTVEHGKRSRSASEHGGRRWLSTSANGPLGNQDNGKRSRSASEHGGQRWLTSSFAGPLGARELADLEDDIILLLAALSTDVAVRLAQCSHHYHQLLRETPALRQLVRLEQRDTLRVSTPNERKAWIRHASICNPGRILLVCHAARGCYVRESIPTSAATQARVGSSEEQEPTETFAPGDLEMPMQAASHGQLTIITDRVMNVAHVYTRDSDAAPRVLTAETMRSPSGVATDGVRVFICGGARVHAFDLETGVCTSNWPTCMPECDAFECDYGVALHRGELFVVDQRGDRVHVFDIDDGTHIRTFGGRGTTPGRFCQPYGVASCGDHVLVSEHSGRRVQAFTPAGEAVGQVTPSRGGSLGSLWAGPPAGDMERNVVLAADWDRHVVHELSLKPWYD